jgi:hypothetical protein
MTAQGVLSRRNRFKVSGIEASSVATDMVDLQAGRNWAYGELEGEAVHVTLLAIHVRERVPARPVQGPFPYPAGCPIPCVDIGLEAFTKRNWLHSHTLKYTGVGA